VGGGGGEGWGGGCRGLGGMGSSWDRRGKTDQTIFLSTLEEEGERKSPSPGGVWQEKNLFIPMCWGRGERGKEALFFCIISTRSTGSSLVSILSNGGGEGGGSFLPSFPLPLLVGGMGEPSN